MIITTFGKQPTSLPPGFFKAVSFPILALLNTNTGDGRIIDADGFTSRDLPLSIRGQFKASYGHDGADVTGALFEVTVDPESGKASGRGFLLNDEFGRRHARACATGAMRGNSVDLAEVKARFEEDLATGECRVHFTEAKLAATTGVCTPAFSKACMEMDDEMSNDELMASLGDDPMVELVMDAPEHGVNIVFTESAAEPVEIMAAYVDAAVQYELFFRPESDRPQKVVVDENGFVYGHLGLWDSCHDGVVGQCLRIPRPTDGYASFNKPGVLTDRGIVGTGPIFAYGGHRKAGGKQDLEQSYGGIENTWCDVRISEGRLGPWISGIVRPGTPDEVVYAARASRISGHWLSGKLKAIVSVNAEGFDVPGDPFSTGFSFVTSDTGVTELVASFPGCLKTDEPVVEAAPKVEPEVAHTLRYAQVLAALVLLDDGE